MRDEIHAILTVVVKGMSLELDGFELPLYHFELFDLRQFTSESGSSWMSLRKVLLCPDVLLCKIGLIVVITAEGYYE